MGAVREVSPCGLTLLRVIPLARWDVEALSISTNLAEAANRARCGAFLQKPPSTRSLLGGCVENLETSCRVRKCSDDTLDCNQLPDPATRRLKAHQLL